MSSSLCLKQRQDGANTKSRAQEEASMAWEKRDERTYYYRTIRTKGKVSKQYFGNGAVGRFAANADAFRRAQRKAQEEVRQTKKDQVEAAVTVTCELTE